MSLPLLFISKIEKLIFDQSMNVIFHGPGGTGKSYLLKQIYNNVKDILGSRVGIVSTTGVSAFNIGGMTIHRWAGIKLGYGTPSQLILVIQKNKEALNRWRKTELLFIDEISMLGHTLFKKLDSIAKSIRNNNKPFGGIQLVLCGDFLQLPPVNDQYFVAVENYIDFNFQYVIFDIPLRYPDKEWFSILGRIRKQQQTKEDIKCLIKRQIKHFDLVEVNEGIKPTILIPLKSNVDRMNELELLKIQEKEYVYKSFDSVITSKNSDDISLKAKERLLKKYKILLDSNIAPTVILKKGAQVMLIRNLDVNIGLVNGAKGIIKECRSNDVDVYFTIDGKETEVNISSADFDMYDSETRIIIRRSRLPLILCWALTIHKVQGCTLDKCIVDIGQNIFSPSMAYVCLSRCKMLDGVYLDQFMSSKLYCDKKILEYVEEIIDKEALFKSSDFL
jgi:ATP-dependent DNA helicase PIF1